MKDSTGKLWEESVQILAACADRVGSGTVRDRDQDQVRGEQKDEDRVGKCIAAGY